MTDQAGKCNVSQSVISRQIRAPEAELIMSERAQFITGATFLVDGGATASYYYGPLQPGPETGMEEGKQ
mgnify:CR=1 FL=1